MVFIENELPRPSLRFSRRSLYRKLTQNGSYNGTYGTRSLDSGQRDLQHLRHAVTRSSASFTYHIAVSDSKLGPRGSGTHGLWDREHDYRCIQGASFGINRVSSLLRSKGASAYALVPFAVTPHRLRRGLLPKTTVNPAARLTTRSLGNAARWVGKLRP